MIEATSGSSVPIKVPFNGPISQTPWIKKEKEMTVPTKIMKATASQPVMSNKGKVFHNLRLKVSKEPPKIIARAFTDIAPHWADKPCDRVG